MTIDLSDPIVIGVSIAIISAAILGIVHYVKTLVQLDFTNKKLSHIFSELDALNNDHKKEIADIKQRYAEKIVPPIMITNELNKHNTPKSDFDVAYERLIKLTQKASQFTKNDAS